MARSNSPTSVPRRSLVHGGMVIGHVELVGEATDDLMQMSRIVTEDPGFSDQLPPGWKP